MWCWNYQKCFFVTTASGKILVHELTPYDAETGQKKVETLGGRKKLLPKYFSVVLFSLLMLSFKY